ncbi:MAG: HAD family hydrolase [Thermoguttaceae bacterium]|nr:HAD family hydrolase [Thermoguttaceae bacterium]MDW8038572.1 HAD family hydrolase [Thermoguttaceae bacterium]
MYEEDYRPIVTEISSTEFLPGTSIEIVRPVRLPSPPKHVLFDFDGTLSLIREGWVEVMVPMMVEVLQQTGTNETPEQLEQLCREFVTYLTGKQTIYQMIRLAEEVKRRGGKPEDPLVYKHRYLERLHQRIAGRREGLRSGRIRPEEMLVPGSLELLEALRGLGVQMYLASGTDQPCVLEEAQLLGLDRYFGPHIYGALDNYLAFSKAMVIERILKEHHIPGHQLLGFGDGYVEIANVKTVGGTAVAVASDEAGRSGRPDPWKRSRLIGAGADLVIPDYRDWKPLLDYLWTKTTSSG